MREPVTTISSTAGAWAAWAASAARAGVVPVSAVAVAIATRLQAVASLYRFKRRLLFRDDGIMFPPKRLRRSSGRPEPGWLGQRPPSAAVFFGIEWEGKRL